MQGGTPAHKMGSVISATDDASSAYLIEAIWDRYFIFTTGQLQCSYKVTYLALKPILCLSSGVWSKVLVRPVINVFLPPVQGHLGDIQSRWGQSLATFHSHTLDHT